MTEVIAGLLFTVVYLRYGFETEFVIISLAVSLLLVISLIDLDRGLILNRIVFPSALVLLFLAPFWSEL